MKELKQYVRTIMDFPIEGIQFRDVTGITAHPQALGIAVRALSSHATHFGATAVVGIESRGFVFGTPVAYNMQLPMILARKPGKLPGDTVSKSYDLEYGSASLEIQTCEPLSADSKVIVIDDLIATGGTAIACADLLHQQWGIPQENILISAVIDLPDLGGSAKIQQSGYGVQTLIAYEGE